VASGPLRPPPWWRSSKGWAGICEHRGVTHRVYLVGGPARVGKSALAQRLLLSDGIPWLPTDVLRTVLRRVLPELDELDQGNVSATAVGELMYPHIEQAVEVCGEEAEQFLIEGPDIVPSMVPRLSAALARITIRSCFLGSVGFSGDDLAFDRGAEAPQLSPEEVVRQFFDCYTNARPEDSARSLRPTTSTTATRHPARARRSARRLRGCGQAGRRSDRLHD
jgi:hypothetical protein